MENTKCKICRRLGVKLFLKGQRCFSPKCAMTKRAYPPGIKGKRRKKGASEYGKELQEKQKLKKWYNLRERQFRNYVKDILKKRGRAEDAGVLLIKKLESRLDNVIFRMGFGISRAQARQMVLHGHFLVNGKKVNVPSYSMKKGETVTLRSQSSPKNIFKNLSTTIKKYQPPSWIQLDKEKLEGKIIGEPSLEEAAPPSEISAIFEYYSK